MYTLMLLDIIYVLPAIKQCRDVSIVSERTPDIRTPRRNPGDWRIYPNFPRGYSGVIALTVPMTRQDTFPPKDITTAGRARKLRTQPRDLEELVSTTEFKDRFTTLRNAAGDLITRPPQSHRSNVEVRLSADELPARFRRNAMLSTPLAAITFLDSGRRIETD